MPKRPATQSTPRHISIVAVASNTASTLFGIYDVLAYVERQGLSTSGSAAFHVEIVGEATGPLALASGVTVDVQRAIHTLEASDILIVPSVYFGTEGWETGRYPRVIEWIGRMHARGATLCSACQGLFLLAETGLFDGRDAT